MNILVIGGAGYIGSHVVREFLDRGYGVTVFDNLRTGLRENLFSEARFVHGDILQPEQLREAMAEGFDGCVHLAALKAAGQSMLQPEAYAEANLKGTINILNQASMAGIRALVFRRRRRSTGARSICPLMKSIRRNLKIFTGSPSWRLNGCLNGLTVFGGCAMGRSVISMLPGMIPVAVSAGWR